MQICAIDSSGQPILAKNAVKQKNYFCMECNAVLRLRGGEERQLHFYHLHPSSCHLAKKSLEHIHTQLHIASFFPSEHIFLEQRFPSIGRIADVVYQKEHYVFEVQCSPISIDEIKMRNHDYESLGYHVVWILHESRFNRARLTKAEEFLLAHPHYFTDMNAQGRGILYDQCARIQGSYRIVKSAKYLIDLSQPIRLTKQDLRHFFPVAAFRQTHWKLFFKGDICDRVKHQTLNIKEQSLFPKAKKRAYSLKEKIIFFIKSLIFNALYKK